MRRGKPRIFQRWWGRWFDRNGVWPRLLQEPEALSKVAREALRVCHFDSESGNDLAQPESCARACYRCLLSYSNQPDHPKLDRFLIRDYLLALAKSTTARIAKGRDYEDQYEWLMGKCDPKSSLEAEFLRQLREGKHRLPDRAQYRPEVGVYCEADFYYNRDGLNGVAVFIDGPTHDDPEQRKKDSEQRGCLDDLGYRVLVVRYDRSIAEQIAENPDIFGAGIKAVTAQ